MYDIFYEDSGELIIESNLIPNPTLDNINDEHIVQIDYIYNLLNFTYYKDDIEGISDTRGVERFWRISKDETNWSDWQCLNSDKDFDCNFELSPNKQYFIQIKWVRTGTKTDGKIIIDSFKLDGEWNRKLSDGTSVAKMTEVGQEFFIIPQEIYKVFGIDGFELIATGLSINRNLSIEYRVSQNSGRTWNNWEELTTENISTLDFSPIRFFQIEYKIKRIGSDVSGDIKIYGLNLIGEFQNVSKDYFKTNLMGIRESCGSCGNVPVSDDKCSCGTKKEMGEENLELNDNCSLPDDYNSPLTDNEKANLFKPYALDKAIEFYNKAANSTNEIFGHEVTYFVTAPDDNAIDHSFYEYSLYNVICEDDMKISVDGNQFPDNQITFNQFDLSLFETFEVHITKEMFKQTFGVDKRPSKEDFLFFCQLNKMFQVEHAQPYRDFNNSSVYYKVILKKYNKKASVKADNSTLEDRISELTKNSTLDELMGAEQKADKERVANKDEHETLSKDNIRYEFSAKINKELIDNASLVINKYNYDLSSVIAGEEAIKYKKIDHQLKVSDNRAYMAWFKLNEYVSNETYNFLTNYDINKNEGYYIDLVNGKFTLTLNSNSYSMPVTMGDIHEDVWYCYLVNVDQRQREITHYLYKRDVADNEQHKAGRLHTSELNLVTSYSETMVIDSFDFDIGTDMVINGSNMSITNIRLFNDVVPENTHNKVLNQYIIRDSQYLILSDNSNNKVDLPNVHPYN